ncbi:SGNH/GDSL hydrolase family protein [Saccharothrix coeruleofusca]|uniref:Lipase 1 n=1 Tax=Saccharothrix coeruleofusca TaxID=33919 RepID=A0A918EFC1_9PSEU|nr:SGNH/GDSL hydrolase family protein [Saccharothrix coeruleofusca]MBP2334649.1 lysophospholipase L1-like esterase [Saccharothrix coeruleofusca]GGP73005.1 lipase 1 [Saccharothrix coeruleofusca]
MNLVAAVLLVALVPAPAAPEHVALGDSYAAGTGAGGESGECKRSDGAHPALLAAARGAALLFEACAGATTAEVAGQAQRVSRHTALVTITVGGNDAGFVDVMTTCVLRGEEACLQRVEVAERFARTDLPGRLAGLYAAVRARTAARVLVMGYPRVFEPDPCPLGLGERKRQALNRATDALVEVTAAEAGKAGFVFVDVRDEFAGHGVCGDSPWVHGARLPVGESYHPNRAGQESGYLPALAAAAG